MDDDDDDAFGALFALGVETSDIDLAGAAFKLLPPNENTLAGPDGMTGFLNGSLTGAGSLLSSTSSKGDDALFTDEGTNADAPKLGTKAGAPKLNFDVLLDMAAF